MQEHFKRHMKIAFSCLFLLLSCGHQKAIQDITQGWEKLQARHYSILYPSSWELDQSGQMGTTFILVSPKDADPDKFRENVNLVIQDISDRSLNLEEYTKISEEQIKTMLPNSVLIESKSVKKDENEYHTIVYSGNLGVSNLTFNQYYWVTKNKAYVLTFTGETDQYSNFRETAKKILDSFKLK